jgi:hypothetical protein
MRKINWYVSTLAEVFSIRRENVCENTKEGAKTKWQITKRGKTHLRGCVIKTKHSVNSWQHLVDRLQSSGSYWDSFFLNPLSLIALGLLRYIFLLPATFFNSVTPVAFFLGLLYAIHRTFPLTFSGSSSLWPRFHYPHILFHSCRMSKLLSLIYF